MTDMTSWLGSLDVERLERVLSHRPDATTGSIPRNLDELAQRLGHPRSVAAVLDNAPAPLRQVVEALLVLSVPRTEAALRDLLERHEPDHDAAVAFTLDRLYDCALAWPAEDGGIGLAVGLTQVLPQPLGLGPPLRSVVDRMTGSSLRQALKHLGDPQPPTRREDAATALWQRLADPAAVRVIVAAAPASIATQLHAIARTGLDTPLGAGEDDGPHRDARGESEFAFRADAFRADAFRADAFRADGFRADGFRADGFRADGFRADGFNDDGFRDDGFNDHSRYSARLGFHPLRYGRNFQRYEAEDWGTERGLLSGNGFGTPTSMPAEIAVALRGSAYRAPFTPYPPPVPATAVDPAAVESGAAAAATDFAGQAVAVLDLIARAPLAELKSGGLARASWAQTRRVISDAQLGGGMLAAWCYLRNDERYFLVDRILSVAPGSP